MTLPLAKVGLVAAMLAVFGGGWCSGRISIGPPPDLKPLIEANDSLRHSLAEHEAWQVVRLREVASALDSAAAAEATAIYARTRARLAVARADTAALRVDAALDLLDSAGTATEELRTALGLEREERAAAMEAMEGAYHAQADALIETFRAVDSLKMAYEAEAARRVVAEALADKFAKKARGCRFLGVDCSRIALTADYTPSSQRVGAALGYRLAGPFHVALRVEP